MIEAIRFIGSNYEEVREFIGQNTLCPDSSIVIPTLEGDMVAQKATILSKGVQGEFYPCKPDILAETYEKNGEMKMLEKSKTVGITRIFALIRS